MIRSASAVTQTNPGETMEVDELTCTETVVEDTSNDGSIPDSSSQEDAQPDASNVQWPNEDGGHEMREESPVEEEVDEEVEEKYFCSDNDCQVALPQQIEESQLQQEVVTETVGTETKPQTGEYQFQLLPIHIHQKGDARSGVYKMYKCDICEQVYRHVFSLKRHFLRCHINYNYLTSTDIANCGIHQQVISAAQNAAALNGDDLYRCNVCNLLFPDREILRTHTDSHGNKDKKPQTGITCSKCSQSFADRKGLQKHQAVHNGPLNKKACLLTCKYCSKNFSTINEVRRHERLHESQDTKCRVCDCTFSSADFVQHKTSTHPDINHLCSYCDHLFPNVSTLGQHLFQTHGKTYSENARQINNKENSAVVTVKEEPVLEIKPERAADQSVSCELCNKNFSNMVNLQRHKTVVHVKQIDKKSPQEQKVKAIQANPTEEEFYRTLAHRISENLQYHIDGRLPGVTQSSSFEPERVESNNCMPWLVNNFPPTLDITHIVQIYANRPPFSSSSQPAPHSLVPVETLAPVPEEQIALGASLGLNPVKKEVRQEVGTLFICQVCGHTVHTVQAINEHKLNVHPNVVATHLELDGHSTVPPELVNQYSLSSQGLLSSAPQANIASRVQKCTKCNEIFTETSELHAHIFQCGKEHLNAFAANAVQRPVSPRQLKQRKFGMILNAKRSEDGASSIVNGSEYGKDDPKKKRKIDDRPQRRSARSTYCGGPSECSVCGQSFPSQASLRKHALDECREEPSYRKKKRKDSPTGTPEPAKLGSSANEGWGDDYLDGKGPEQYHCRACPLTFPNLQQFRRHTAQCSAPSRSKTLLSYSMNSLASNSLSRSQFEEMTVVGLVQRTERERQRDAGVRSEDTEDDEDTKVYRCPTCDMGFGDYVKMIHHSMQEHGARIPDPQTYHRESSSGSRNNNGHQYQHHQLVIRTFHGDEIAEQMREEEVHSNENVSACSTEVVNAVCPVAESVPAPVPQSLYDSEDLRDKERIAVEALSAIFGGGMAAAANKNNNNNNNNNDESNKYNSNRHAQPLMDHRY